MFASVIVLDKITSLQPPGPINFGRHKIIKVQMWGEGKLRLVAIEEIYYKVCKRNKYFYYERFEDFTQ